MGYGMGLGRPVLGDAIFEGIVSNGAGDSAPVGFTSPPPCNFNLIVKGGRGSLPPPPPSTKVRGVTVFL